MHHIWKLHSLLTSVQRHDSYKLLVFMFVGMLLEIVGVGLIVPALMVLVEAESLSSLPVLSSFSEFIENNSRERLVVMGMIALSLVYFAKSCFLTFLAWRKSSFVYDVQASLSARLYSRYLYQPYTFHLTNNSAFLIRNTMHEVNALTNGNSAVLVLISEGMVLVGLAALLLYIEFVGALVSIGVMTVIGWILYRLTKNRLSKWGQARLVHDGNRMKELQQGFGAVKELKLLNKEEAFIAKYDLHNLGSAKLRKWQDALNQMPRIWLELLAVVGLALIVVQMIRRGSDVVLFLPTLGVFAVAAFRLIPSISRVIGALQTIRFTLPVIDTIYHEFSNLEDERETKSVTAMKFQDQISIENLTYHYPGKSSPALSGINIRITRGSIVGIIGSSGAGKSTLINIILGLLSPQTGGVFVDGKSIGNSVRDWQIQIGYVPQSIFLTDDLLSHNIALGVPESDIDYESMNYAVAASQLTDFVEDLDGGLKTSLGERGDRISGGQIQRIGIARALYLRPSVLILDEATSALDRDTEQDLIRTIRNLKGEVTIIIISHKLATLEISDVIYELKGGDVIQRSSYEELATTLDK